jgi:hypothetical protein
MYWKKSTIIASVFLVLLSACSLPGETPQATQSNEDGTAAIQTQVAGIVASAEAVQTIIANDVAATLAALATSTPEFTFTPSLSPTLTITFTPSLTPTPSLTFTPIVPMVSVSQLTNCRSGPGTAYEILGVITAGQNAEVVGRSAISNYWIIKLPSNPAITCTMWGQFAAVTGNTAGLPAVNPPPTPTATLTATPAASFQVVYTSMDNCGGGLYEVEFQITNNGNVTWESNRIIATDQNTAETRTIDRNDFPNHDTSGCGLISADLNLEPGEVGHTSTNTFSANPAGHNMTTTIRVCSQDGMTGTCAEKTITFTP